MPHRKDLEGNIKINVLWLPIAPAKVSIFPELSCLAFSPSLNGELLSLGLREFSKVVGALKEKPSLSPN